MAVPSHIAGEGGADLAGLLRAPSKSLSSAQALAMAPTSPFLLKHHWSGWEVASEGLDEATWLPQIKRHTLRPGANHTRTLRVGQPPEDAYRDGVAEDSRAGWTFLEQHPLHPDHRPASVGEGPYMREAPCRDPRTGATGTAYVEAWQVPLPTMPGDEDGQRFRYDRGSYNRWRLWLVESGQIAPPQPHVLAKIRSRYEARVPRAQSTQYPTTDMQARMVQAAQAVVDQHESAAVPEAPAKAEPPPPKPRKPKRTEA